MRTLDRVSLWMALVIFAALLLAFTYGHLPE